MTNDGYTKEIFEALDFKDRHARVLEYLFKTLVTTGKEIQFKCKLQQPEVSLITTSLEDIGIIFKKLDREQGKGRPIQKIYLKKSASEALRELIKLKRETIKTTESNLTQLDEFFEQNPNEGAEE